LPGRLRLKQNSASFSYPPTHVTLEQIEIVELGGGKGTYDVDWQVHGVRQGTEGYRVVRPKRPSRTRVTARPRPPAEDELEELG
jgi:hypothetical protein